MLNEKEKELIRKAKQGDEKSMETLILSCTEKAYSLAYRYLNNEHDAMDAVQESFIRAFRGIKKFNEESKFDTWVYRIVVNCCNDLLKKRNRWQGELIETEEERPKEPVDTAPVPEEILIRKEKQKLILKCLEKLPADQKEIIILRDINQFSYSEISNMLDLSEGTVKSRINRARQKLKEIYLSYNKDGTKYG